MRGRACVVHASINSVGGGERVALTVIEALKRMGYEVWLITTEPTDWARVERITGLSVRPDRELAVSPRRVQLFGIYLRLLTFVRMMLVGDKCDVSINTHGDVLPVPTDVIYMHFPTFALLRENPVNVKYSKSLFWRLYFYPYEKIQGWLARRMDKHGVILTNSEYSRAAIRRHLGADAIVVHPPVDTQDFEPVGARADGREDRVVLCGRYSPEKNYEFALRVAAELPDVEFTIIGASSGKISNPYYSKLRRIVEREGLRNVELLRDVPRRVQVDIYGRSKVYMHAMVGEHFGVAVVEGMAAGLVPVVHMSGGPWLDIIDRGRYGLGYRDVDGAADAVRRALRDYGRLRDAAITRARHFSRDQFISRFSEIIETVVGRDEG